MKKKPVTERNSSPAPATPAEAHTTIAINNPEREMLTMSPSGPWVHRGRAEPQRVSRDRAVQFVLHGVQDGTLDVYDLNPLLLG